MKRWWLTGVLFVVMAGSATAADPLAEKIGKHGVSNADPVLTEDVMKMANSIVPLLVEHDAQMPHLADACPTVVRADTVITRSDGHGGWSEDWTFKVCSFRYTVPIEFVPDSKGGTYFTVKGKGRLERPRD